MEIRGRAEIVSVFRVTSRQLVLNHHNKSSLWILSLCTAKYIEFDIFLFSLPIRLLFRLFLRYFYVEKGVLF